MQTSHAAAPVAVPARIPGNRDRITAALLGLVSVVFVGAIGFEAFLNDPTLTYVTLAPLAGMIAALSCRKAIDAAIVASVGTVGSVLLAAALSSLAFENPLSWLPGLAPLFFAAAVAGAFFAWVAPKTAFLNRVVLYGALAIVIGSMWMMGTFNAANKPTFENEPLLHWLAHEPHLANNMNDPELYLAFIDHMRHGGEGYYASVAHTIAEKNDMGATKISLATPLSYRPPTVYALIAALPTPTSIVLAMLALGTLATVCAFALARRFVVLPIALVSAMAVATLFGRIASTPALMYTEAWAGALGLASVTALVYSRARGESGLGLFQVLAVTAALLAAACREIAVAYLVLGFAATVYDATWRRTRSWSLWLIALAVFTIGMVWHWSLAGTATAALPLAQQVRFDSGFATWFEPTWRGIDAVVRLGGEKLSWKLAATWPLFVFAVIGALAAPRDAVTRLVLGGTVIGGLVAVFLMRPPVANVDGILAGYWGYVVLPAIIACAPLALSLVPAWRAGAEKDPESEDGTPEGAVVVAVP